MYFSQHKQDQFLNENFFKNKKNGFFLDIGAHDGVSINNTLFFEKELGWKGICFEPMPDVYEKLVKNRTCDSFNYAVSEEEGESVFLRLNGYTEMLSGLKSEYTKEHLRRIDYEINLFGGSKEEIKVNCINLNNFLENKGIFYVDYCSIDTEGNEMKILNTIDFEKINIFSFSIENNNHNNEIKRLMKDKGYKLIEVLDCDEIYIKK
jgi:FkbM family methyltransferase